MKIAYLINSLEGGGTTSPLPDLFELMRGHGAKVRLFALEQRNRKGLAQVEAAGVTYEICEPPRGHLATMRWIEERVAAFAPDILWTSLSRATLLGQRVGRTLGIPVVSWQHNLFLKPANALLLRWQRDMSALWIADSGVVADMAQRRLKIAPGRIATWPIFRATPSPHAQPGTRPPLQLGSLGRLHPAKGYDLLIEAMERIERALVPDYHVTIGGTGAEQAKLEAMARARGVDHRLTFAGHVDRPEAFLKGLDAYLQPSRREGFGIAAHEAMAAGLPILAGDTGEMAVTIAEAGGGLAVPVEQVDTLATSLHLFLTGKKQWPAMGQANRDYVQERYSPQAFAAAGDAVMERVKALLA